MGETALHVAAASGRLEIVRALLAADADIHATNADGETALHVAAVKGYLEIVHALLTAGANIHAMGGWGTALHVAAASGRLEIVRALTADANIIHAANEYGETALHAAAVNGCLEVVRALLTAGANIHAANADGETAIDAAFENGWHEVVDFLRQEGARLNARLEGRRGDAMEMAVHDPQNVHAVSVHESVSKSAKALKQYYKSKDLSEARQAFRAWANGLEEQPKRPWEQEGAAVRSLKRLSDITFTDARSRITMEELLGLVWLGAEEIICDKAEHKRAMVIGLYEIQREYNLDEAGQDNRQEDSPSCSSGSFNKLVHILSGKHPSVTIKLVTWETVRQKVEALVHEKAAALLKASPSVENTKRLEEQALPREWLPNVRTYLAVELEKEFSEFKGTLPRYDEGMKAMIDALEDMTLSSETIKRLLTPALPVASNASPLQAPMGAYAPDEREENLFVDEGNALLLNYRQQRQSTSSSGREMSLGAEMEGQQADKKVEKRSSQYG